MLVRLEVREAGGLVAVAGSLGGYIGPLDMHPVPGREVLARYNKFQLLTLGY